MKRCVTFFKQDSPAACGDRRCGRDCRTCRVRPHEAATTIRTVKLLRQPVPAHGFIEQKGPGQRDRNQLRASEETARLCIAAHRADFADGHVAG
jgi:hypothetical protein